MKLRIAAAVALASTMMFAGTASAQADEGSRPMGVRLETQLNPFNLVGLGGEVDAGGNPHGDIKIGYDLDMGLTPLIGIGYRSFSTSTDVDGDNIAERSSSAFVIDLELRYYLSKHRRGLQPFVFGELNTAFVSFDEKDGDSDALDIQADENDFTEVNLGIGAEYKFTRSFAVGGKWGLAIGFQPVEDEDANAEQSNTTFGTSSGVYLAWRL